MTDKKHVFEKVLDHAASHVLLGQLCAVWVCKSCHYIIETDEGMEEPPVDIATNNCCRKTPQDPSISYQAAQVQAEVNTHRALNALFSTKPTERRLSQDTKETILQNVEQRLHDGLLTGSEHVAAQVVTGYVIALLENQYPSFWEK